MHTHFGESLGSGKTVPGAVARAIRFMQGQLATRLSAKEIAIASDAPERTLRRQFKRFTGQSLLAFHRNLRLDAVHRLLRAGDDHADVTTVAADHGFIHFGQFARDTGSASTSFHRRHGGETARSRRQCR